MVLRRHIVLRRVRDDDDCHDRLLATENDS
jgi:hypothetical protein